MDRADDIGSGLDEFEERAVPQANLLLPTGFAALGGESELVEQADEVVDRFLCAHLLPVWGRRFQPPPPRPARGQRLGTWIAAGGKAHHENLGEQSVMARSIGIHLPDRTKH